MFVCDCNFKFAKWKYFTIKHALYLDKLLIKSFT